MKEPSSGDADAGPGLDVSTTDSQGELGTGVESEDVNPGEPITQPFDPTLIRVDTKPMTIDLLLSRVEQGELDLTPDFQRKAGIWSNAARAKLIESLLIRIPLPAFYMDATDDDRWIVVDGLQRLSTLKAFVLDKTLVLQGLEFLGELEGKKFDQLPRYFQRRIKETQVVVYLIEKGTPAAVKFNVFKRINTGGLPLSAQEIRHALNQGPVTKFLARLAGTAEFKEATNYGIRDDRMADRECVLRFAAFSMVPPRDYKATDLDSFLNDQMAKLNSMSEADLAAIESGFVKAMKAAKAIFGPRAFRKSRTAPLNKALFEAWSVNLAGQADGDLAALVAKKDAVAGKFNSLLTKAEFDAAISQATGNPLRVRRRFEGVQRLISDVLLEAIL